MNALAALRYLFAAIEHGARACARTRAMIATAIDKLVSLLGAQS